MRLCVEDPPAEVDLLAVSKEQVEILERLAEEEGLHHVLGPGVERAPHVADGGVAAAHLRVLLDSLRKREQLEGTTFPLRYITSYKGWRMCT